MPLSVGIVGLPNVGKSTLFNALTKQNVVAENYPFATIDPNVGVVAVPDERLEKLAALEHSKKIVPTIVEFIDIAGLVKDAHSGEGLGNKFLSHIREVDAIAEVVRFFEDPNVLHVEGKVDPDRDVETIKTELILADLATLKKRLEALHRDVKSGDKLIAAKLRLFERLEKELSESKLAHDIPLQPEEQEQSRELQLLTSKPFLLVANTEFDTKTKKYVIPSGVEESLALTKKVGQEIPPLTSFGRNDNLISIDAKLEAELSQLADTERTEYLKELGLQESGLDRLIKAAYQTLGLITFLTTGPDETRAWTVRAGSSAPVAAGVIHTDFERGFIKAEVINWKKLLEAGSWNAARDKGWIRTEGKEYIIQDGDVVFFKFNV